MTSMTSCLRTTVRYFSSTSVQHAIQPQTSALAHQVISTSLDKALKLSPEEIVRRITRGDTLDSERKELEGGRKGCELGLKFPGLYDVSSKDLTQQVEAIKAQESLINWSINSKQ